MTASALMLAVVGASVFVASGLVVSLTVKRAFLAAWRGSLAVVAVAMIGICWALGLGQLLGAFGWLRPVPLVVSAVAGAAVARVGGRRLRVAAPASKAEPDVEPASTAQPALLVATVLLVLFVGAVWTARTVITARQGIHDPDSLGYHVPFAATFAQTGFADPTRFEFPTSPVQFFPANDELLAGIALVLTKSLAFAAVKNLVYGGLVLVAAHAVGRAFGAGLVAVSAAAIVLGLPAVAFSQAGEAVNDTLPVLALLSGLAILAHARDRPAPYVLALACAGVAYGSKYSTVLPAVALAVLALCLLAARLPTARLRAGGAGAVASLAVGGSWYLRNAITYGNPLPPARVAVGPLHLRHISVQGARDSYSVAWYLVHGTGLRQLWRGLGLGLGPLFLFVLVALAYGTVTALRAGGGFRRGVGLIALVTLLGYLILPGSAYGAKGSPYLGFVINLHYAIPSLVVGMVAAALALGRNRRAWALPATGWVVVATGVRPGLRITTWAPEIGGRGFALLVAASLAGGAVAWMSTQAPLVRWVRGGAAATVVLALVGSMLIARQLPRLSDTDEVLRWADSATPTRIGGWAPAGLLYGSQVRNRVVTLTRDRSVDGGPIVIDTCPAWMEALQAGNFPFAAVVSTSKWQRWLDADPAFELVAQNDIRSSYPVAVYRVAGTPDVWCRGVR